MLAFQLNFRFLWHITFSQRGSHSVHVHVHVHVHVGPFHVVGKSLMILLVLVRGKRQQKLPQITAVSTCVDHLCPVAKWVTAMIGRPCLTSDLFIFLIGQSGSGGDSRVEFPWNLFFVACSCIVNQTSGISSLSCFRGGIVSYCWPKKILHKGLVTVNQTYSIRTCIV